MAISEFFAGIPVADFDIAVPWYERLWGKPPDFYPEDGEAVWQITDHSWVYVVTDRQRAGNGLITLLIDDLDERIVQLTNVASRSDRSRRWDRRFPGLPSPILKETASPLASHQPGRRTQAEHH